MNYRESNDYVLNAIINTYHHKSEPYGLAKDEMDKRKRKRARPKHRQGVKLGTKRGPYIGKYQKKYGHNIDGLVDLLGVTNNITIRDLERAGLLKHCITLKKLRRANERGT